jgi:hypothetical protein
MSRMVRKQVCIERRQEVGLKARATELGVTEAELIREGIDCVLEERAPGVRRLAAWEEAKAMILEWAKDGPASGGRTWTRDDLYDRHGF